MATAEDVARIIDPDLFRRAKLLFEYCIDTGNDAEAAMTHVNAVFGRKIDAARQKANEIMELIIAPHN